MPLDGVTAKCLAGELTALLADARVDKIHQPDRYDIFLHLRNNNGSHRLIISANPASPRLHITSETRENPASPPMFCMLLRKYLGGARLLDVTTPDYERIFTLRFSTISELGDRLEKRLIVELMGRHSNIILINEEDRIHDSIVHIDDSISRVREVMPARPYCLPPGQDKLTPAMVLERISHSEPWIAATARLERLDKAILASVQGFSPQLCQELVFRTGCDERLKPQLLSPEQSKRLNDVAAQLLRQIIEERFTPTTFYNHQTAAIPLDFHALPLLSFAFSRPEQSVSAAMDRYYLERVRQNTFRQKKQSLAKKVGSLLEHARRKLEIHEKDCAEGAKNEQYRLYGELILANLHLLGENASVLQAIDYSDPEQSTVEIPVNPHHSGPQNAKNYFRLYNKAKSRLESGRRLAAEDKADIAYLETLHQALATAEDLEDLQAVAEEISASGLLIRERGDRQDGANAPERDLSGGQKPGKKKKYTAKIRKKVKRQEEKPLPPRRYTSSDGFTILVGRNNYQNDRLTLKTAQKEDIWLHTQKIAGTHVIIRSNKQEVPERTLLEAAQIAAWFSRATAASGDQETFAGHKVAVDYCPVSHVRKPKGARPGMVIYDRYQTLLVTPQAPPDRA